VPRPPTGVSRLVLPVAIQDWSLTSLQQLLFKTGGRLIRRARYFSLQLAETYLTRTLFRQIVARIEGWRRTRRDRRDRARVVRRTTRAAVSPRQGFMSATTSGEAE